MKVLTEKQIDFIIKNFFEINTNTIKFPGWYSIAKTLLEKGNCIVAGDTKIWLGGIGNFIKTKEAPNAINCLLYEFDLDSFLRSIWFTEVYTNYIQKILEEKNRIIDELYEASTLFDFYV